MRRASSLAGTDPLFWAEIFACCFLAYDAVPSEVFLIVQWILLTYWKGSLCAGQGARAPAGC